MSEIDAEGVDYMKHRIKLLSERFGGPNPFGCDECGESPCNKKCRCSACKERDEINAGKKQAD